MKIRQLIISLLLIVGAAISSYAQTPLTAAQMNIYFGQPKNATITNPQGSMTYEFDRSGRVIAMIQGPARMTFEWAADNSSIKVSMYNNSVFQGGSEIVISEFTPAIYDYTMVGEGDITVTFRKNGSYDKMVASNTMMTLTTQYCYHNESDMYPYAVEMSNGSESVKVAVIIEATDSKGNATRFKREMMGMQEVSTVQIEYY